MRKFASVSLLTVLSLLAALLLVACGDNTNTPAPAATSSSATTAAAGATTASATTAAGATTAASATTAAGATTAAAGGTSSGKKLKVGLVTDVGRIDDKSFNQSAWEGVQKFAKDTGADVKYVETKDTKDYAKNIKQFTDEKYDVVVSVGFLLGDATTDAAKANPNIKFIGVDQFQQKPVDNLAGLVFEEDKAGFLAGVLAAGMSQKGKIASILGTKSVPAVARYGEGYKAGAAWLDANHKDMVKAGKTEVNLTYHPDGDNAFGDPTWGAQQAQSLIQSGFDVIFGAGGGTGNGAIEGAASQGAYVIGVDTDQYLTLPKAAPKMLSSATKLISDGVYNLLKAAQGGSFKGGNNVGPVGLAPFHDMDSVIPAGLKDLLKTVDAGLKDGTIKTGVNVG
ncbi:MAG TPA: BMP family ABC transporter substrate-binding protein [Chloroflexia bacterium]|nr:BMP family ABC transporter substrate-binding protein [Chloroflexia bacterium]